MDAPPPLVPDIKVRAITRFICLGPDWATWPLELSSATWFRASLVSSFRRLGYARPSLRIVTNPFGEYLDCASADTALAGLKVIKAILAANTSGVRIRFALGAGKPQLHCQLSLLPAPDPRLPRGLQPLATAALRRWRCWRRRRG